MPGIQENNIPDAYGGDESGEHQGYFPEAKKQVGDDNRDHGEGVTGGDGKYRVAIFPG